MLTTLPAHFTINLRQHQERLIPVTQKAQELAKRLLAYETGGEEPRAIGAEVEFRVFEKLRVPLASLAGAAGFDALVHRAFTLTRNEIPKLRDVKIGRNGDFENLTELESELNAEEAAKAEVVLIGNVVDLLCIFVGETLALRLIQDVWPDASFNDRDDGKDDKA